MATAKPGTYKTLDMWRGVAALMVVFHHGSPIVTSHYQDLVGNPFYHYFHFGYLGVQLFFVISGYCIANSACSTMAKGSGWWSFMRARLRRVMPPCWASLVLVAAVTLLTQALTAAGRLHGSNLATRNLLHQPAMYYFANLTLTQMVFKQPFLSGVCWTLCYEIAFYVIVSAFLVKALHIKCEHNMLRALHAITAGSLVWLIIAPHTVFYPFNMWPEFGLGVIAYDILRHSTEIRPKIALALTAVLLLGFVAVHHGPIGPLGVPSRLTSIVSLAFTIVLLSLHEFDEAMSRLSVVKVFMSLGGFSYSLYLTHFLCLGLVHQALKHVHLPEKESWVMMATMVISSLIVARIFFQWFERPFHNTRPRNVEPAERSHSDLLGVAPIAERTAIAIGAETETI